MKGFARFILFSILGWKLEHDFPQDIKKYVVIKHNVKYMHTLNVMQAF